MGLSRREKEILARIEGEFTSKEARMAALLDVGSVRRLLSTSAMRTWLLLLGLLALGLAMIPTLLTAACLAHGTTGAQPPTIPPAA